MSALMFFQSTHLELCLQRGLFLQQPACLVICLRLQLPVLCQLSRIQLHTISTLAGIKGGL